jgi:hypothetical protein
MFHKLAKSICKLSIASMFTSYSTILVFYTTAKPIGDLRYGLWQHAVFRNKLMSKTSCILVIIYLTMSWKFLIGTISKLTTP